MEEIGGLYGNFKLSLQSVVCHRGNAVDSGHYIALVRGTGPPTSADGPPSDGFKTWMRFDDLAPHRITVVDIEKALKEETPYLLFYQIVPIEGDPGRITSGDDTLTLASERNPSISSGSTRTENLPVSGRPSFEMTVQEDSRGRSSTEIRRASVVSFQDQPPEYSSEASLAVPNDTDAVNTSSRFKSLSRTQSKATDGIGRTLSKLRRKSREILPLENPNQTEVHVTEITDQPMSDRQAIPKQNPLRRAPPTKMPTHRREKSRSRISRSKGRSEKPDRECIVM